MATDETDLTSPYPYWARNGLIFFKATYLSKATREWRHILDSRTPEEWFADVETFIPGDVKKIFGGELAPTAAGLLLLPLLANDPGVYADILSPRTQNELFKYAYVGCATHRSVKDRAANHSSPSALKNVPGSKYYQLKHGGKHNGRYISFAVVKMDHKMGGAQLGRRRMFCRLIEAMFAVWIGAMDTSYSTALDLASASERAFQEAYGSGASDLEWAGLCTHSPLVERTCDHTSMLPPAAGPPPSVAELRYEEAMAAYGEMFGGREYVPEAFEAIAKQQSAFDLEQEDAGREEVLKQQKDVKLMAQRNAKKREYTKMWRETVTQEERNELSRYHAIYYQNRMAAMSVADKAEQAVKQARNTRKYRVRKAFNAGVLTQQQFDAAKADDWREQRGFPMLWSRLPSKKKLAELAKAGGEAIHATTNLKEQLAGQEEGNVVRRVAGMDVVALSARPTKRARDGTLVNAPLAPAPKKQRGAQPTQQAASMAPPSPGKPRGRLVRGLKPRDEVEDSEDNADEAVVAPTRNDSSGHTPGMPRPRWSRRNSTGARDDAEFPGLAAAMTASLQETPAAAAPKKQQSIAGFFAKRPTQ
ncbi:hypothetical protein LTR53_013211 [Teratosphaeriaceae sp. CCFEE 6253]|nr:hypothetical protein LTR53_013211 [Teratosphaeriaceae sp. CCFEE 6253]